MNLPKPFPGVVALNNQSNYVQVSKSNTTYAFEKAGTNGNLITMVIDESGSMTSCWDATIDGFNEYVNGQRNAPKEAGEATLTLIKFDSPKIIKVFENRPLNDVPELNKDLYRPNGMTNLLDAIGDAINSSNAILSSIDPQNRPGIIITIMTDGKENSSKRFNNAQITAMVKAAEVADWSFVFLGANIDSFSVGSQFGMSMLNSVNYSTSNMGATMASVSASTTRMRTAKAFGASTQSIYESGLYTDDELKSMKE